MCEDVNYNLLTDALVRIAVNVGGNFTVYNSLCAVACALQLGISADIIVAALASFKGVKGRAEVVETNKDFTVIIDYAHTPDGMKQVLTSASKLTSGKTYVAAIYICMHSTNASHPYRCIICIY
mgnify:CR=1 FL=1